ncbi:hypothetical protein V494_03242 [Pseudogymnoascus sp. VKM F-4513 (FW-928)]|nr:hypothetical protein V494_03242 [Pseudogymnoascus sp. VKM F-4513 (FW-928)]
MLVFFVGRIAAATAVATALEAIEAGTAAGESAAAAADDTPDDGEDNESADDDGGYYWPSVFVSRGQFEY